MGPNFIKAAFRRNHIRANFISGKMFTIMHLRKSDFTVNDHFYGTVFTYCAKF